MKEKRNSINHPINKAHLFLLKKLVHNDIPVIDTKFTSWQLGYTFGKLVSTWRKVFTNSHNLDIKLLVLGFASPMFANTCKVEHNNQIETGMKVVLSICHRLLKLPIQNCIEPKSITSLLLFK